MAEMTFFIGGVKSCVTPHLINTPNNVVTTNDLNDRGIRPRMDFTCE